METKHFCGYENVSSSAESKSLIVEVINSGKEVKFLFKFKRTVLKQLIIYEATKLVHRKMYKKIKFNSIRHWIVGKIWPYTRYFFISFNFAFLNCINYRISLPKSEKNAKMNMIHMSGIA